MREREKQRPRAREGTRVRLFRALQFGHLLLLAVSFLVFVATDTLKVTIVLDSTLSFVVVPYYCQVLVTAGLIERAVRLASK